MYRPLLSAADMREQSAASEKRHREELESSPPPRHYNKEKPRLANQFACKECRPRKVKCDGKRPKCGPCGSPGAECVYIIPEGMTGKQFMGERMTRIEQRLQTVTENNDRLRDEHDRWRELLDAFRNTNDPRFRCF